MNRRLLVLLAIPAAVAIPAGVAHANSFTADADCDGVTFGMARGEAGTIVTVTVDGRFIASQTVAAHGDPVNMTAPTPDRTVAHTWVVTVDSVYNADQRWSETVPACSQPVASTSTTTVPASTTVPNPSTTVGTTVVNPTTTTSAPTTQPPTVVTTPRPTPTTSTVPFRLPDTGFTADLAEFAVGCLLGGLILIAAVRRGGAK